MSNAIAIDPELARVFGRFENLAAFWDQNEAGFIIIENDRFVDSNPYAQRILQRSHKELATQKFSRMIAPEHVGRTLAMHAKVKKAHETGGRMPSRFFRNAYLAPDGNTRIPLLWVLRRDIIQPGDVFTGLFFLDESGAPYE